MQAREHSCKVLGTECSQGDMQLRYVGLEASKWGQKGGISAKEVAGEFLTILSSNILSFYHFTPAAFLPIEVPDIYFHCKHIFGMC